jgi:hypothetical protein
MQTYAGVSDWWIRKAHPTIAAEMLEQDLHRRLSRFRIRIPYWRSGREVDAKEAYCCPYRTARDHLLIEIRESGPLYAEIAVQVARGP